MSIFNTISQQRFINEFWQQKPFKFAQSFPDLESLIDGNELAGLACDDEIESRIISGHELNGNWHCQQGPFEEAFFNTLSNENWTLLVQGLDQWNVHAASLLEQFTFLPNWRLEDIMASYATIGGGVGPHYDYYDVFLIQASGGREWQLGQQCDNSTALQDNDQVKLLAEFDSQQTVQVNAGDMLYIPAGLAHWGIATSDDCITLSVGFRAPSHNEVLIQSLQRMIEQLSQQDQSQRYQDSDKSIDFHPHKINQDALSQLAAIKSELFPEEVTELAFGQLVTQPRYENFTESQDLVSAQHIKSTLAQCDELELIHASHSRFAFSDAHLFANGEAYTADESFSKMVCDKVINQSLNDSEIDILLTLLEHEVITLKHI